MAAKRPNFSETEIIDTLNSNNYFQRNQIDRFNKFSRYGFFDPYNANSVTREYVFFTKMDLNLFVPNSYNLNPQLENIPFFTEALQNHRDTMEQLQYTAGREKKPFCNLLSNNIISKIDLGDISMGSMETAANIAGTKLEYPLATTESNNIYDFNAEFEDTKNLDVYMFFRIWYEYELLKVSGAVSPPEKYIENKIIHDQMSCYKIIVGEDFETIIHWSKFWGVYPTSIPRSVFSDLGTESIKLPVSFKCQWVDDMDPNILSDLNRVVKIEMERYNKDVPLFDINTGRINSKWCNTPHIVTSIQNHRRVYKLKWR